MYMYKDRMKILVILLYVIINEETWTSFLYLRQDVSSLIFYLLLWGYI